MRGKIPLHTFCKRTKRLLWILINNNLILPSKTETETKSAIRSCISTVISTDLLCSYI